MQIIAMQGGRNDGAGNRVFLVMKDMASGNAQVYDEASKEFLGSERPVEEFMKSGQWVETGEAIEITVEGE